MQSPASDGAFREVVLSLCERINTPRALSVWLCFKYNNHEALVNLTTDTAVWDTERFMLDYFITEYLTKYKALKISRDPKSVALEKWRLSEVLCRETNMRFRSEQLRPTTGRVSSIIFGAQRKIAAVLGTLHMPLVLADCKWGPGATADLRREEAALDTKISGTISVTAQALPFIRAVLEADPHWSEVFLGLHPEGRFSLLPSCFKIVRGSRFLTVPKNAKTDRCIAAEPTGNGFLQQGVHSYMRRRLKRFGVDLDDQSINQEAAKIAYASGLSTLDLSAASDTISTELVFHLLPLDWALFLDSLRSHETRVGKKEWVRTEKFASMGNAFCFELETLIFWALASTVAEQQGEVGCVTVYGDDIIVPRSCFDEVCTILIFCGFKVNEKKSFKDGYFFESCGKHYHKGFEVTPVYQKEPVRAPSEIIRAHNRLIRFADRLPRSKPYELVRGATRRLRNAYSLRPFPSIPHGVKEDGGFLRPLGEFITDPNHGFRCHVLDHVTLVREAHELALYAYKLRRPSYLNVKSDGSAAIPTKGKWRTRVRWIPWHEQLETVALVPLD